MRCAHVPAGLMLGPMIAAVLVTVSLPGPDQRRPCRSTHSLPGRLIACLMPPHLLATPLLDLATHPRSWRTRHRPNGIVEVVAPALVVAGAARFHGSRCARSTSRRDLDRNRVAFKRPSRGQLSADRFRRRRSFRGRSRRRRVSSSTYRHAKAGRRRRQLEFVKRLGGEPPILLTAADVEIQ